MISKQMNFEERLHITILISILFVIAGTVLYNLIID